MTWLDCEVIRLRDVPTSRQIFVRHIDGVARFHVAAEAVDRPHQHVRVQIERFLDAGYAEVRVPTLTRSDTIIVPRTRLTETLTP